VTLPAPDEGGSTALQSGLGSPESAAAVLAQDIDLTLLQRVEDSSLNASAPPQQRWLDGWLVRYCPGKAKRARCINAVALGQRSSQAKLAECEDLFQEAGLPLVVRITPFTQPAGLDAELAHQGWTMFDDTRVMVLTDLQGWMGGLDLIHPPGKASRTGHMGKGGQAGSADRRPQELEAAEEAKTLPAAETSEKTAPGLPPAWTETTESALDFARTIGALRGSSAQEIESHAQRLQWSPVPHTGLIWRDATGTVQACGQFAREGGLVGLYDVFTAPAARGRGLARALCARLLQLARDEGARTAYLQVDAANAPARKVYTRLGFQDVYTYHYRSLPA
jgi:GNAT superfamily N-acetyltransferase